MLRDRISVGDILARFKVFLEAFAAQNNSICAVNVTRVAILESCPRYAISF